LQSHGSMARLEASSESPDKLLKGEPCYLARLQLLDFFA